MSQAHFGKKLVCSSCTFPIIGLGGDHGAIYRKTLCKQIGLFWSNDKMRKQTRWKVKTEWWNWVDEMNAIIAINKRQFPASLIQNMY